MHVITRKRLLDFAEEYQDARVPLDVWFRIIKSKAYQSIADIKQDFSSADYVKGKTVFDIGGNKYRLITVIHYNTQRIYIRNVLTHKEYDKGDWR
jgi:mRNA interferase HigB